MTKNEQEQLENEEIQAEETTEAGVEETVETHNDDVEVEQDAEMSKSEARDYADEQIDEKFMDDVTEAKMTPERATKKIKEYEEEIETLKIRIEEISPVAELPNLDPLKDLVKEQTISAVENMTSYDMKESSKCAKAGISGLESIAFTEGLLRQIRSELSSKKSRIEFCEKEIESLKAQGYQGNLFDKDNSPIEADGDKQREKHSAEQKCPVDSGKSGLRAEGEGAEGSAP